MSTAKICEFLHRNSEFVLTEISMVSSGKGRMILPLLLQVSITTV